MRLALFVAILLVSPLAAAQVPVPIPPLPIPPPPKAPQTGPYPDESSPTVSYSLSFGCPDPSPTAPCPTRESARGETLTGPSLAIDAADPTRIAMASLAGAAHDRVTLRLSLDSGRTYGAATLPESGATGVALASIPGTLLLAETTAAGIVVRRLPFEKALETGAPEATIPASGVSRLSAAFAANGSAVLAWGERDATRVAWSTAPGAWTVATAACKTPTNLGVRLGVPLVACAVADALPDYDIPPDHLALYALNVTSGNLTLQGHSPVVGEGYLLVNETGGLMLAGFAYESPTRIHLKVTSSRNGTGWFLPSDAGSRIHRANAPPAASARILAMDYQPSTQTIHLIWAEVPQSVNGTDRRVVKSLVAMSTHGQLYFKHDLDVDEPPARAAGNAIAAPVIDASDALLVHGARELIAFGDDGALVHGEIIEHAGIGVGARPVVQPPQNVSLAQTELTNRPPPKFTVGFEILGITLVVCVVARVLYGRVVLRSASAPQTKKEGP